LLGPDKAELGNDLGEPMLECPIHILRRTRPLGRKRIFGWLAACSRF
jgi:hypothetical protein